MLRSEPSLATRSIIQTANIADGPHNATTAYAMSRSVSSTGLPRRLTTNPCIAKTSPALVNDQMVSGTLEGAFSSSSWKQQKSETQYKTASTKNVIPTTVMGVAIIELLKTIATCAQLRLPKASAEATKKTTKREGTGIFSLEGWGSKGRGRACRGWLRLTRAVASRMEGGREVRERQEVGGASPPRPCSARR